VRDFYASSNGECVIVVDFFFDLCWRYVTLPSQ